MPGFEFYKPEYKITIEGKDYALPDDVLRVAPVAKSGMGEINKALADFEDNGGQEHANALGTSIKAFVEYVLGEPAWSEIIGQNERPITGLYELAYFIYRELLSYKQKRLAEIFGLTEWPTEDPTDEAGQAE